VRTIVTVGMQHLTPAPLVIAHRGASWDLRENTLAAFERAIDDGADYVELDVQATRDGELVVYHDLRLDRLTKARGPLRRRTLAELRALDPEIPTLAEVVELAAGRVGIMAELKSPYLYRRHDIVRRTLAALDESGVLVSFEPRALREALRLRSGLRVVQHVGFGVSIRRAAGYAWAVGLENSRATARAIARSRALGLETTAYTVNDPERMRALAALGVTGIFTDRPDLLRRTLAPLQG
jgi:glycerophosphoryl diester phosphodiesterase